MEELWTRLCNMETRGYHVEGIPILVLCISLVLQIVEHRGQIFFKEDGDVASFFPIPTFRNIIER